MGREDLETKLKGETVVICYKVVEGWVKFNSDEAGGELVFFTHLEVV